MVYIGTADAMLSPARDVDPSEALIMMIIRHLQYLTALAQERHFARAAAVCNVTQSTLSAGIKQLEESLGVLIVERGHRFLGLTEEGERVIAWAQRVLADYSGLQQELSEMREGMVGQLRIGAIPVSLPIISLLTAPFAKGHQRTNIVVTSQTSIEIQRRLDEFGLDVGVTYLDNEPLARVRSLPLYQERYLLITRPEGAFRGRDAVSWSEAAGLPLCLLTPDMQNRRILDMHFREAGAEVHASIETNSLVTLWSHLRFGHWSSIVPHTFLLLLGEMDGLTAIPLTEPDASHLIGLVASDRDPLPPVANALLDVARRLDIASAIDRKIGLLSSSAFA
jgi:DNA-binding transcriptional LysR family regulator